MYDKNLVTKKILSDYLILIYYKEQLQKLKIAKINGKEQELVKQIFKLKELKELIKVPAFFKEAAINISQGTYVNNKVYFYPENFYNWIMNHLNNKGE